MNIDAYSKQLLTSPGFWKWLSRREFSCSESSDDYLDLYRRECGWDEHISPSVGIPEYYENELHAQRMRKKRLMKKRNASRNRRREPRSRAKLDVSSRSIYDLVGETFSFRHHEGTNRQAELNVLKCILIREGYISRLLQHATKVGPNGQDVRPIAGYRSPSAAKFLHNPENVVDMLADYQDVTADLVLSLMEWRRIRKGNTTTEQKIRYQKQPFMWRSENIISKICHDVDFICDCESLVTALGVDKRCLSYNPLLLPTNLESTPGPESWFGIAPPRLPRPKEDESISEERKRRKRLIMRRAEAAIVLEEQLNELQARLGDDFVDQAVDLVVSEISTKPLHEQGHAGETNASVRLRQGVDGWYGRARAQLDALRHPSADFSDRKSRGLGLGYNGPSPTKAKRIPREIVCFETEPGNLNRTARFLPTSKSNESILALPCDEESDQHTATIFGREQPQVVCTERNMSVGLTQNTALGQRCGGDTPSEEFRPKTSQRSFKCGCNGGDANGINGKDSGTLGDENTTTSSMPAATKQESRDDTNCLSVERSTVAEAEMPTTESLFSSRNSVDKSLSSEASYCSASSSEADNNAVILETASKSQNHLVDDAGAQKYGAQDLPGENEEASNEDGCPYSVDDFEEDEENEYARGIG